MKMCEGALKADGAISRRCIRRIGMRRGKDNFRNESIVEGRGIASHLVSSDPRRNDGLRFGGEAGPT